MEAGGAGRSSVDEAEVERFGRLAAEWWDPKGKFKPLHVFNPVRLAHLKSRIATHFARDERGLAPFSGLSLVDVGCGGGLVAEPMARLGAEVLGIDASETNVEVAQLHAEQSGVALDYRATTAEALRAEGRRFDVVLALEIVEHVSDVPFFLETVADLAKPGGLVAVATINRTLKAFGLAIVGAEYVLGWLPRGTHAFDKLVRPEEIERPLAAAGLVGFETVGVTYNPLQRAWRLSPDIDVNYMTLARKPG